MATESVTENFKVQHIPVLKEEVLKFFKNIPLKNFCDMTVGEGNHSRCILEKFNDSTVIGIDRDPDILGVARENLKGFEGRFTLVNDKYSNIKKIINGQDRKFFGFLMDLGLSNFHFKSGKRGFSFRKEETLDMRFDISDQSITAGEIINQFDRNRLLQIISEFGEERFAGRIVDSIIRYRQKEPIESTFQLKYLIFSSLKTSYKYKQKATARIFQALRIFVNSELVEVEKGLKELIEVMPETAVAIVISYHSLEDRIVKNLFKDESGKRVQILTKKPVIPTRSEKLKNRKSRSAKLRAIKKINPSLP